MNTLLAELAADADIVDEDGHPPLSAHTLRHTFGTNLIRAASTWSPSPSSWATRGWRPHGATPSPPRRTSKQRSATCPVMSDLAGP